MLGKMILFAILIWLATDMIAFFWFWRFRREMKSQLTHQTELLEVVKRYAELIVEQKKETKEGTKKIQELTEKVPRCVEELKNATESLKQVVADTESVKDGSSLKVVQ